jgi:hypothetical protein
VPADERADEERAADAELGRRLQAELPTPRFRGRTRFERDLDETVFKQSRWPDWLPNPLFPFILTWRFARFFGRCLERLWAWARTRRST